MISHYSQDEGKILQQFLSDSAFLPCLPEFDPAYLCNFISHNCILHFPHFGHTSLYKGQKNHGQLSDMSYCYLSSWHFHRYEFTFLCDLIFSISFFHQQMVSCIKAEDHAYFCSQLVFQCLAQCLTYCRILVHIY